VEPDKALRPLEALGSSPARLETPGGEGALGGSGDHRLKAPLNRSPVERLYRSRPLGDLFRLDLRWAQQGRQRGRPRCMSPLVSPGEAPVLKHGPRSASRVQGKGEASPEP